MKIIYIILAILAIAIPASIFLDKPKEVENQPIRSDGGSLMNIPKEVVDFQSIRQLSCGDYVGTGFVISPNMVVTASHTIGHYRVCRDFKSNSSGVIVENHPDKDYAILRFPAVRAPSMKINCNGFTRDETYFSFGWRDGEEFVTYGVTATGEYRSITPKDSRTYHNMSRLIGTLIPGMSGGPIVDKFGVVTGINNASNWSEELKMGSRLFSRELRDTTICGK